MVNFSRRFVFFFFYALLVSSIGELLLRINKIENSKQTLHSLQRSNLRKQFTQSSKLHTNYSKIKNPRRHSNKFLPESELDSSSNFTNGSILTFFTSVDSPVSELYVSEDFTTELYNSLYSDYHDAYIKYLNHAKQLKRSLENSVSSNMLSKLPLSSTPFLSINHEELSLIEINDSLITGNEKCTVGQVCQLLVHFNSQMYNYLLHPSIQNLMITFYGPTIFHGDCLFHDIDNGLIIYMIIFQSWDEGVYDVMIQNDCYVKKEYLANFKIKIMKKRKNENRSDGFDNDDDHKNKKNNNNDDGDDLHNDHHNDHRNDNSDDDGIENENDISSPCDFGLIGRWTTTNYFQNIESDNDNDNVNDNDNDNYNVNYNDNHDDPPQLTMKNHRKRLRHDNGDLISENDFVKETLNHKFVHITFLGPYSLLHLFSKIFFLANGKNISSEGKSILTNLTDSDGRLLRMDFHHILGFPEFDDSLCYGEYGMPMLPPMLSSHTDMLIIQPYLPSMQRCKNPVSTFSRQLPDYMYAVDMADTSASSVTYWKSLPPFPTHAMGCEMYTNEQIVFCNNMIKRLLLGHGGSFLNFWPIQAPFFDQILKQNAHYQSVNENNKDKEEDELNLKDISFLLPQPKELLQEDLENVEAKILMHIIATSER